MMKLETRNVSRAFGDTPVLDDISLQIGEGEFVSIVGTSGCGKTTMLRIIGGLEDSTSGEVLVDGRRISGPDPSIAVGFQADRMLPWRSVRKNIRLGLELRKMRNAQTEERLDHLIDLVGLTDFQNHHPYQLSGGMRQRANLARALVVDPDVLLLDEPFAALDAQTREVMQAELLRIWSESAKTVMFVTHQIDEAVYLSDRVVVFSPRPGRLKEIVDIDLPRPRDLSVKRTPEFNEYVSHIWSLLGVDPEQQHV